MTRHTRIRVVYDRIGRWQDTQSFYEDAAFADLVDHADFDTAQRTVELGCGTGRFAERLLRERLPKNAEYLGVDLSRTMVRLAERRIDPFGDRATVRLIEGDPPIDAPDGTFDRFVSTYVFDLLTREDCHGWLDEAHRLLEPGGLLAAVCLCPGVTPSSRAVMRLWRAVYAIRPGLVGGCRPIELGGLLSPDDWTIRHRRIIVSWGMPSEVLVAARRRS